MAVLKAAEQYGAVLRVLRIAEHLKAVLKALRIVGKTGCGSERSLAIWGNSEGAEDC